jgi:hypothetical protein
MTTIGREAAIALEDERRSAKHQLRPNIGLSGSSNEVPVKMQYERMALGSRGVSGICLLR